MTQLTLVLFALICLICAHPVQASDFCDFEPLQARLNVYDFPAIDSEVETSASKAAEILKNLFLPENEVFRSLINQSRVGGQVRSDIIRAQLPLSFSVENGRIKFTLSNQIRSLSYDIDASGARALPPRLSERSYDNTYELWQNQGFSEWIGFMTTSNDTNGDASTRGVTIGKAYFLQDGSFVFDSTAPHPSLYRTAGGKRIAGLSATRSTWQLDFAGKLMRTTSSLTFPVDASTMNLMNKKPSIERFCNLISVAEVVVKFPAASSVQLYTDAGERGGKTEASLCAGPNGLRFTGTLTGLINSEGVRLGFAGIRVPLVLMDSSSQLKVNVTNLGSKVSVRAVVKTSDSAPVSIPGVLTYQAPFEVDANSRSTLNIDLSKLVPTVRGVEIDAGLVPSLRPSAITRFGIEIRVTDQIQEPTLDAPKFDLLFEQAATDSD